MIPLILNQRGEIQAHKEQEVEELRCIRPPYLVLYLCVFIVPGLYRSEYFRQGWDAHVDERDYKCRSKGRKRLKNFSIRVLLRGLVDFLFVFGSQNDSIGACKNNQDIQAEAQDAL